MARLRLAVDNTPAQDRAEQAAPQSQRLPLGTCLLLWGAAAALCWALIALLLQLI